MGDDEATFEPEDIGELDKAGDEKEGENGSYEIVDTSKVLGLVPSSKGDGSYDLTMVEPPTNLQKPRERREPWKVGVTDKGEDVYAPIAGPNAVKVLPLKAMAGVCCVCRCTVHRRSAVVDPWANIYCKGCWPYGAFEDPRDENGQLPPVSMGAGDGVPKFPEIKKIPELPPGDDDVER